MAGFKNYREAHTEWAIFFIKFIEMVLALTCMIYHMQAVLYIEEPMPHNMLFCATFGGFFILSLAGIMVPLSGQLTPPGVDMIFSIIAFISLFCSACAAMYYIAEDEHLKNNKMSDHEEAEHPFFKNCYNHCILSLVTGTFFLMHAVIATDRLIGVRKGLDDAQAEINSMSMVTEIIVDIDVETPITLHLFMLDWWHYIWKTRCVEAVKACCICNCCRPKNRSHRTSSIRRKRMNPHFKAHLLKNQISRDIPTTSTGNPDINKRW